MKTETDTLPGIVVDIKEKEMSWNSPNHSSTGIFVDSQSKSRAQTDNVDMLDIERICRQGRSTLEAHRA